MRVTSPDGWVIESDSAHECIEMLAQLRDAGKPSPPIDLEQVCGQVYNRLAPMIKNLLEDIERTRPTQGLTWHVQKMADGTVHVEPANDANGVTEQYTPNLTERAVTGPKSHRHVSPSYKKRSHETVKPWTPAAVALFADGAIPSQVVRDVDGITQGQASYVRQQYAREIAELAQLPYGEARFKYLQDRFGFGCLRLFGRFA